MLKVLFAGVAVLFFATAHSSAATVSVSYSRALPSIEAINGGAPNTAINQFFLTSDADVLAIDRVAVTGAPLYQVAPPFGSDVTKPDPIFLALVPALASDSWLDTPGRTHILGPDLPGDGNLTLFGDVDRNGPQTHFQFASLTFLNNVSTNFSFRIQLAGAQGPETFSFNFVIPPTLVPEPATFATAGMGLIGSIGVARRRRA
jgi:hypothetical protein